MILRRSFIIVCFLSVFKLQATNIDSLLLVLKTHPVDSNKVKLLQLVWKAYNLTDPVKALPYIQQGLDISNQINWRKGVGTCKSAFGATYFDLGEFAKSLQYRQQELDIWKSLGLDHKVRLTYAGIGACYCSLGKDLEALEMYMKALRLSEDAKDSIALGRALTDLGAFYGTRRDTAQAIAYMQKALLITERFKQTQDLANNLVNIANIYCDRKLSSQGRNYYLRAIMACKEMKDENFMPFLLFNVASSYESQADSARNAGNMALKDKYTTLLLRYCNQALEKAREQGNEYIVAHILNSRGTTVWILKKDFDLCLRDLDEAMRIATAIKVPELLSNNYRSYYKLYKESGDNEKALLYHERWTAFEDSLHGTEIEEKMNELELKYKTEKKDAENKALLQQNQILALSLANRNYVTYGTIAATLLFSGLAFFLFRQQQIRSKQKNALLEQKLLQSRMNPHFIFNSLSAIESYIYEHKPKEAGDYLARFSRLMRLTLENSSLEKISLKEEVQMLNYYLDLQKLRANGNLNYSIHIEPGLNAENVFLPPMLLQPFIENIVEHAFHGMEEKGRIGISFSKSADSLKVNIRDNGIGYLQAQIMKQQYLQHKSMAIEMTRERLLHLNKMTNGKYEFSMREIDEQLPNRGTEVQFIIPV